MGTWYDQLLDAINAGTDLPIISNQDNIDELEDEVLSTELGKFGEK